MIARLLLRDRASRAECEALRAHSFTEQEPRRDHLQEAVKQERGISKVFLATKLGRRL